MSTEILFDTAGHPLADKSVIKPKATQIGSGKVRANSELKSRGISLVGSAATKTKSSLTQSLNRKVDYQIQQESNKIVIKIRDGETGEVIRQIPQEELIRLMNRISDFNRNILDETV